MATCVSSRAPAMAFVACSLMALPGAGAQDQPTFKSGVELVNVTATVTDSTGRFVDGLTPADFRVFDDDTPVDIAYFRAERVPVSLGLLVDTSGSMTGEKMQAARDAIEHFLLDLLHPDDEVFLYAFSSDIDLVQDWTSDRRLAAGALGRLSPSGGTAMYDAVLSAVPMADAGRNRKKAVVVISDGNDTNSDADVETVGQAVRQSEVLVYAVGIDGRAESVRRPRQTPPILPPPSPIPFPVPGGRRPGYPWPPRGPVPGLPSGGGMSDRVNAAALRAMTDESGGRTEIVRNAGDIDPATSGIAHELSQQYYLSYPSPGHADGKWHHIRVEVRNPDLRVRARQGYVAPR